MKYHPSKFYFQFLSTLKEYVLLTYLHLCRIFQCLSTVHELGNFHQPEKSLNSAVETPTFLFFVTAIVDEPLSIAVGSVLAFLAFKYFPTPPPPPPPPTVPLSVVPVPGLLYHDPIFS